ncbi:LysR family transcriptional regulator [Vibrio cincinnatiensis]|uniref:LysR family transcriptional regulator n=1 Tax=Vibrio cincinnatiensis TaxID=675 RepID=UPI001EDDF268|nr:LysR family transcriptional regulator [Vibrio cincinnatiensis]MCG3727196.1 LysR family transcriptional regulator [Vibrio cincinnatiensis]
MINPIWLKTFKTLVDVGHFTQTAEQLNMTQPGVSQHIAKLEAACHYPLIKRFNKQFELTIHGKKVYQYAQKWLEEEQQLLQELGHDEPFKGKCTLGCSGTLAWLLYSPLLELQMTYPELTIELEATPNERIYEQVQKGAIDIGLVTKPPSTKYFDSQIVGVESLVFVVPSTYDRHLPLTELLPHLGVVRHPDLEHYFHAYLSHSNDPQLAKLDLTSIPCKSYINQVHQVLLPVAKGIGFSVVPKCCVRLFSEQDKLAVLPVTEEIQEPLYLVTKRNAPLAKRYELVVETIQRVLNSCNILSKNNQEANHV